MKKLLLFGITSGLLLSSPIYAAKVSKASEIVTSTIIGQGFLKTQGGDVKTCAGNDVYLEQYIDEKNWVYQKVQAEKADIAILTNYMIELAKQGVEAGIYDKWSLEGKRSRKSKVAEIKPEYNYKTLDDLSVLKTQCDANGNFEFIGLKKGKYIIATKITWKTEDEYNGGPVSKIVDIQNEKNKILLTQ